MSGFFSAIKKMIAFLAAIVAFANSPESLQVPDGAYGIYNIPALEFSVNLYHGGSQSITDAQNSANYVQNGCAYIVCDHYYQGFDVIKKVTQGMKCRIKLADGKYNVYECVEIYPHSELKKYYVKQGGFYASGIFDGNDNNLCYRSSSVMGSGIYLLTYTCNVVCIPQYCDEGIDVYTVLWKVVQ